MLSLLASPLVMSILGGFAGGLLRAFVGVLKWQVRTTKTKKTFSKEYFLATFLLSGLLGVIAGLYVENDPRFAILAGYAGTDFIEGLYKIRFRERYRRKKV